MDFHRLLLTFTLAIYLFTTFAMAYLVVDRRFEGHYSQELNDQSDAIAPAQMNKAKAKLSLSQEIHALAVGIPSKITYFLKNTHEEMTICNVQIKDLFSPGM